MDNRKYIGMDVHQASISIAVADAGGKLVMESVIETKATTILEYIQGLRGSLWVTFEEGTSAAWLYDLLKPHVSKVVVCDPRKNALLKAGNKNDRVDARKLSDLLRAGLLTPVYHGESGVRPLRELSRSYLAASRQDGRGVTCSILSGHRCCSLPIHDENAGGNNRCVITESQYFTCEMSENPPAYSSLDHKAASWRRWRGRATPRPWRCRPRATARWSPPSRASNARIARSLRRGCQWRGHI